MGVSVDCILTANKQSFRENILFTHKGISGPAALQGSLYWTESSDVFINMLPDLSLKEMLFKKKKDKSSQQLFSFLSEHLAQRVVEVFCQNFLSSKELTKVPLCQVADKVLEQWAEEIQNWKIRPSGTVGYTKAEVTKGGVCTSELSSKTMEAHKVKGLYFIGEVVDVSGWLGGYNFQWAWASAAAAANSFDSA
jgi:predicted Rossmann fold flavoprotein